MIDFEGCTRILPHFYGTWFRLQINHATICPEHCCRVLASSCQIDFGCVYAFLKDWYQITKLIWRVQHFFGRIQCAAAEFWNEISGKLANWFWGVHWQGWRGGDSIRDQQLLEAQNHHTHPTTCQLPFDSDIKPIFSPKDEEKSYQEPQNCAKSHPTNHMLTRI